MFLVQQFLPAIFASAFITCVLLVLSALRWKKNAWSAAVAIGIGYAGGHAIVAGWPSLPPVEATGWLAWFVLGATVAVLADLLLRLRNHLRVLLWMIFYPVYLWLLLQPKLQYSWSLTQGATWIAGITAGVAFLSCSMERTTRYYPAIWLPATLTLVAAGTSVALILSGSVFLSQLASVFTAAICSMAIITFLLPSSMPDLRSIVPIASVILTGLWLCGYFYAELPASSGVLLMLAAAFHLPTGERGRIRRWATLIHAIGIGGCVAGAVLIAFRTSPPLSY